MKKLMIALALVSSPALADGFVCESADGALTARVYNHTQPELGTRTAAVLVLSDNNVQSGNKTIAKFTEVNGTLDSEGASYVAKVDHRFNDSGRKGELIGGTKIAFLKTIKMYVNYSYAFPLTNGTHVMGRMTLVKRDGSHIGISMDCARYLKN